MARPSKMSEPRVEAILKAIEHGCTREAAAGAGGIGRATLYRWIEGDETFRDEVEKAELRAEAAYTMSVAAAVPKNWQAAAWWLERRHWQRYGKHDRVDMTVDLGAIAERVASEDGLDRDALLAEAEAVLRG